MNINKKNVGQNVLAMTIYKLDMGKSCVRFKKLDDIPFDLIADLMQKSESII